VVLILFIKFTYLSYSFINYEGYVKFMNSVTITMSDEQMTKIKVVYLEKL
jgi:hypothetical protein